MDPEANAMYVLYMVLELIDNAEDQCDSWVGFSIVHRFRTLSELLNHHL